jgi:hypothetical protein
MLAERRIGVQPDYPAGLFLAYERLFAAMFINLLIFLQIFL